MPRGKKNKTRKTSTNEIEYSWSKVSNTKLKSPKRSIEMTKPTRSCKTRKSKDEVSWIAGKLLKNNASVLNSLTQKLPDGQQV
jgi:hypothetical protein